jgi:phosphate:Na+ symporter
MLHIIGNLERLGDHAMNLLKTAREISDKKIVFSQEAYRELDVIRKALDEIMDMTFEALEKDDVELAKKVEPLEQVIDGLTETIKFKHIERLQNGVCTIELGFVLADMLSNFERVSDHCSNIAVAIIETSNNSFKTHEYLSGVKNNNDETFNSDFERFKEKYAI